MVGDIAPASWSIVGPNMAVQGSAQWGGCRQASSLVVSRLCVGNAIGPTPSRIFRRHCRHPMRLQTGGAAQHQAANAGAKESSKANKKIKDLEATSVARKRQREAREERLRRRVEEISQNLNAPVGKPSAQERLSALRARVRSRVPPQ